jgi:hypothetical protein
MCKCGSVCYCPGNTGTASNGGGIYTGSGTSTGSGIHIPYTSTVHKAVYYTFKLPVAKVPELVFVNGLSKTVGLLGSKAECAFAGDALILSNENMIYLNQTLSITLQYRDVIYHYAVDFVNWAPRIKEGTTILDAQLLSEVTR